MKPRPSSPAFHHLAVRRAAVPPPHAADKRHAGAPSPEMKGAGIVNNGLALPKPPPVSGKRPPPVASWANRCPTRS